MPALEGIGQPPERIRLVLDNILFATDFSAASKIALRYALTLARRYHGKIYIISAARMDSVEAIASEARQRVLHESRTRAMDWVAELQLRGELNEVRHEIPVGDVAERTLSQMLKNQGFDLAINGIGCHEGQLVLLEPTVEEVIMRSRCPVLTIGSQFRDSADDELKKIVYATDFSPESLGALRYALSLAQEFQARLTLLHVVEGVEPMPRAEQAQIAKAKKLWLAKLVSDKASTCFELGFAVEFGRPAERILQLAWENHADLVVLGARGQGRLTSPGLNVRKVMCNAWCPVLTVSGPPDSKRQ